jgi:hypothetical protein
LNFLLRLDIRDAVDIYIMDNVSGLRNSIEPTEGHFLPSLQKRRRRKRDRIVRWVKVYASLFWFLFAVLTCWQASRLAMGEMSAPGPGFFPLSLGVATGILSLIAFYQAIQSGKARPRLAGKERVRWWNIIIIIGAVVSYTLSVGKIGFLINTFLLITLLLKVVEPQSWKTSILGGLITAVASEVVFNLILKAQIPTGLLGF